MKKYKEEISREEQVTIDIKNFIKLKILNRKNNHFIFNFEKFIENFPELVKEFEENPVKFINTIKGFTKDEFEMDKLRIINFDTEEDISNFRVEHIGRLYRVKGMISKTNKVVALVKESRWKCEKCGTIIRLIGGGRKANGCSCGNVNDKKFTLLKNEYTDIQEIDIE